jgi:hypothetical protein
MCREMHDGIYVEPLEQRLKTPTVARVADDKFAMEHGATKAG